MFRAWAPGPDAGWGHDDGRLVPFDDTPPELRVNGRRREWDELPRPTKSWRRSKWWYIVIFGLPFVVAALIRK